MSDRTGKTGSEGRQWIELDRPKPPKVPNVETYWMDGPPKHSEACDYWVRQIERGWLPNRSVRSNGYYNSAEWFGVYIWEYINVLAPMISAARREGPTA